MEGCHHQHGGNSARDFGELPNLHAPKVAAEDSALAVGQPLLEHLVAAEPVVPDGGRYVAPKGLRVEVDIEGRATEIRKRIAHGRGFLRCAGSFDNAAPAGHHRIAAAPIPRNGIYLGCGAIRNDKVALSRHARRCLSAR